MKTDIHPTYYPTTNFTCVCGATFVIGSTKEKVNVEICSQCHPFYTGTEKTLDSAGRVDKFNTRKLQAKAKTEGSSKK
jgi:large subunit ribosomal protein L31